MAAFMTQQELDALLTLGQVMDYAQIPAGDPADPSNLRGAFLAATGATETALPRIFGVIPEDVFDGVINAITIAAAPPVANTPAAPPVPPNLFQRGNLITVGLICRLKTGLLDSLVAQLAAAGGTPAPVLPPQPNALVPATSKIKLGLVARQGDDTEVTIVGDAVMSAGTARWEHIFGVGKRPNPDAEATDTQITCLKFMVDAGQAPTVDFALWGPHGHRMERKFRLSGVVFDKDGHLRTVEIAGPPTLAVWLLSWEVFVTACVMLNIFDLGTLLAYKTLILTLHSRYGPQVWLLLYQADTRFRQEHLVRTKRRLAFDHEKAVAASGTTAYDKDRPWDLAMSEGTEDKSWWNHEFTEPAVMLLARTANMDSIISNDAPVQAAASQGIFAGVAAPYDHGHMDHSGGGAGNGGKKRKADSTDLSTLSGGEYTANRKGSQLCPDFQTGACGPTVGRGVCPKDRTMRHQCALCLDEKHGKHRCTSTAKAPYRRPPPSGKGQKGKGKGKGKGKY